MHPKTTPKEAVMNRTQLLCGCAAAAAAATFLAGLAAAPATARPDLGGLPTIRFSSYDQNCPLNRIDTQLMRCDNLTGAGVTAPGSVPEL
jgi:hypothetical protein